MFYSKYFNYILTNNRYSHAYSHDKIRSYKTNPYINILFELFLGRFRLTLIPIVHVYVKNINLINMWMKLHYWRSFWKVMHIKLFSNYYLLNHLILAYFLYVLHMDGTLLIRNLLLWLISDNFVHKWLISVLFGKLVN